MRSRALLFLSVMFCGASFGEAYICNIDHHEDISSTNVSRGVTAILFSDYYISGHKASYKETIGPFNIKIICENDIKINVVQGQQIMSDVIEHKDSSKRFSRDYVSGRSGLRISCQKRSIGQILVEKSI